MLVQVTLALELGVILILWMEDIPVAVHLDSTGLTALRI
jgi:hypothetical protein